MPTLDEIPWGQLSHAYGTAEDVPRQLLALKTAPAETSGEDDSPLWCLFGSIWHQGTVYEATSYAVPFLLELAADPQTPDRIGILDLLGAIAHGESGESPWAKKARSAVTDGFDVLIEIAKEPSDVHLAAAHVLAYCTEKVAIVGPILERMLASETRTECRAALILLLARNGDRSEAAISVLISAAQSGEIMVRLAAAAAGARLRLAPMPKPIHSAIIEALTVNADDVFLPWREEESLSLYWDDLLACLSADEITRVANELIGGIESGAATSGQVSVLVYLLFPMALAGRKARKLKAADLSPTQRRAVTAMNRAMQRGKRIFYGHFPQYGLPDSNREWKELADRC